LRLLQNLKVLRGIRDRLRGLFRQFLDRALPLSKQIKNFKAPSACHGLADAGELATQTID
jgi:hypothetical protein